MTRLLSILLVLAGLGCSVSFAQVVDCVSANAIHVKRIQGTAFDPLGTPIPNASIRIYADDELIAESHTDKFGKFSIPVVDGRYSLKVESQSVLKATITLVVGHDLNNLLRKQSLYVVLGIRWEFCDWATTNKKEYKSQIKLTKQHLEESVNRNATQK
jgi:hypothetical protein